jgi:glycerol-3-phosphate acyltransferase PlsY
VLVNIESVALIMGAYLVGSVPTAYLVAKYYRGIDIRQYGPGHVGVGSIWALTPKKVSLPVVLFDLGKGMGMVWAAKLLGMDVTVQVAVGLAAIVGHNWPVFLRFNGGRGILTALGVVFTWWVPWGLVIFLGGA